MALPKTQHQSRTTLMFVGSEQSWIMTQNHREAVDGWGGNAWCHLASFTRLWRSVRKLVQLRKTEICNKQSKDSSGRCESSQLLTTGRKNMYSAYYGILETFLCLGTSLLSYLSLSYYWFCLPCEKSEGLVCCCMYRKCVLCRLKLALDEVLSRSSDLISSWREMLSVSVK